MQLKSQHFLIVGLAALSFACSAHAPAEKESDAGTDAGPADAGPADAGPGDAGPPFTVTIATSVHITESGTPDVMVTVPDGSYSNIKLHMEVSSACNTAPPQGMNWPPACDPYDRLAQITRADTGTTPLFLLDAVTSFGGDAVWEQDITDYAALLIGTHDYHIRVDVYSDSTGMATGTMASHDVSVSIILTPGQPPHDVLQVIPLFRQEITSSAMALTDMVTPPAGATAGRLDFFTSGHGGNGEPPCDEFCQKVNDLSVDTTSLYDMAPWVMCSDNCTEVAITGTQSCGGESFGYYCAQNPTSCPSSAIAPRSNWCPSQIIQLISEPWPASDLTGSHTVGLNIVNVDGDWSVGVAAVFWK